MYVAVVKGPVQQGTSECKGVKKGRGVMVSKGEGRGQMG